MNLHEKINDDFIWNVITDNLLSTRRRGTATGWINICCPMCLSRGESADREYRCGILRTGSAIFVSCFHCKFIAGFSVGSRLSANMMSFLQQLGVPDRQIKLIAYQAAQCRQFAQLVAVKHGEFVRPSFAAQALPAGSQSLQDWDAADCRDPNFLEVISYLLSRGEVVTRATVYYWSPEPKNARRLIIPCHQDGRLVGWISRSIDPDCTMKYLKQLPNNFLFNADALSDSRRVFVFVVEGSFDALAIEGVAALGSMLNDRQIRWLNSSGKTIVVIPDRDKAGRRMVDIAVQQHWAVSIPNYGHHSWWDADIKDVDEAVARYGKLYALQSIIASITTDPTEIKLRSHYL